MEIIETELGSEYKGAKLINVMFDDDDTSEYFANQKDRVFYNIRILLSCSKFGLGRLETVVINYFVSTENLNVMIEDGTIFPAKKGSYFLFCNDRYIDWIETKEEMFDLYKPIGEKNG